MGPSPHVQVQFCLRYPEPSSQHTEDAHVMLDIGLSSGGHTCHHVQPGQAIPVKQPRLGEGAWAIYLLASSCGALMGICW